jgi:tRNA A58 N-methylase Trm61
MSRARAVGRQISDYLKQQTRHLSQCRNPQVEARAGFDVFAEGDRVLIQDDSNKGRFTPPLKPNALVPMNRGLVLANEIIGKPLRPFRVYSNTNNRYVVTNPTLEEYITRTPRKVTPIYSSYCASIVDLLDIHVSPHAASQVEVLDAGTGHGALALHLAKAIAAGNPCPPPSAVPEVKDGTADESQQADDEKEWRDWRGSRRAIVHTIDDKKANSDAAKKIIRGFRQGLYYPHINFYCDDVTQWVEAQYADRGPFLSYAVLDLPTIHAKLDAVIQALVPGGKLCVFVPSISQIADCQRVVQDNKLPLLKLKVVELGDGISTGRDWDVRFIIPRAEQKKAQEAKEGAEDSSSAIEPAPGQHVQICRPKVGDLIQGGGFVGIWQKWENRPTEPPAAEDKPATEEVSDDSSLVTP